MDFSFADFEEQRDFFPAAFNERDTIDTAALMSIGDRFKDSPSLDRVWTDLTRRTTPGYFDKLQTAQMTAREYARKVFPAYRYILPETVMDDWLSIVDLHSKYPKRDHSLHQSLCAYIVAKMLGYGDIENGLILGDGKSLLKKCAESLLAGGGMSYLLNYVKKLDKNYAKHSQNYDLEWATKIVYEAAVISALFHDIGYPWQYVKNLADKIEDSNFKACFELHADPKSALDGIHGSLLSYPLYGYDEGMAGHPTKTQKNDALALLKAGIENTHGVPGALSFLFLNKDIRSYDRVKDICSEVSFKLILEWASVGIMMHDMVGIFSGDKGGIPPKTRGKLRLKAEIDPLSCIVSLADILQEFQRPAAFFSREKGEGEDSDYVSVKYGFSCLSSGIEITDGILKIQYCYSEATDADKNRAHRIEEVEAYLKNPLSYLDLSFWGIKDVRPEIVVKNNVGA